MNGMHKINTEVLMPAEDSIVPASAFAHFGTTQSNASEQHLIDSGRKYAEGLPASRSDTMNRLFDIVMASAMIVVLAPVMLLVCLLIVITDPGPVIFRHRRVGLNGQGFDCLKFRTMRIDAEAQLQQLLARDPAMQREWDEGHKLATDPRVTAIGTVLRVSSLDELPQLFNVLRGDMSLVGPRPITTEELVRYGRYSGHYLNTRPGLTGLWQVSGRSATTFRRRVAADVLYVRNKSMGLDLRIMLATLPAVIASKGAC